MQAPNPAAAASPSHGDVVARLDDLIASIYAARRECHERIRSALGEAVSDNQLAEALGAVDVYAAALEDKFNDLIELKLHHPAAWADCEGARQQRRRQAVVDKLVVDALAVAFGVNWPENGPDGDQPAGRH